MTKVWEAEDQRLWDQDQEFEHKSHRVEWGVLTPGDTWVRMLFTTEAGARDSARRHPEQELVRRTVEVVTTETFNDWEVVEP